MSERGRSMEERSAELARHWIRAWVEMDLDWLRRTLAPDFVHTSPFGRLEGRDPYLAAVEPMARKSVMKLTIKAVLATGDQAAIWFENETPQGVVVTCDWIRVEGDSIKEIRSFYDPTPIRETLTADEQDSLDGTA